MDQPFDHPAENRVGRLAGAERADVGGGPDADENAGKPDDHDEHRKGGDC